MSTDTISFRIQGTDAQFRQFEHQCQVTELMLASTLIDRFQIPRTQENLELISGWMASARSMGIGNHLMNGIKMELVDERSINRPTVVCLCGSTRFSEAFRSLNLQETIAGRIVLSIGCDTKSDAELEALGELTAEAKAKLDQLHLHKIDLADEILVVNVDDYIGESTTREIAHARATGKRVRWLTASRHALPGEEGAKPVTGEQSTEQP